MLNDFSITPSGENAGCYRLMSVIDGTGRQVKFVIEPRTYFVDQAMVGISDQVTGYYDADVPVPMIYPP